MRSLRIPLNPAVVMLVAAVAALPLHAEDVGKKFRMGLGLGFLNGQGQASSSSANTLTLVDSFEGAVDFYRDPRNDSSVFGSLEFQSGWLGSISGQYALTSTLLVEVSAGYQKTKMGDIEVQAQFDGVELPDIERFVFTAYEIEAGDVEWVPVAVSMYARFRPRARLNPYLGGGFGYTWVGFEPSDGFNELSVNLDASQGRHVTVTSAWDGNEDFAPTTDLLHDLDGAKVDIGGTWTWHAAGGLELSFRRKWVAFLDLRYSLSSREAAISFDGSGDLGVAVPALTDYCANPPGNVPPGGTRETVCPGSPAGTAAFNGVYGPTQVQRGGLIDGGRLVPKTTAPPGTNCADSQQAGQCVFAFEPDGVVDTGYYYVQGGSFNYDAFSMIIGVRYTF